MNMSSTASREALSRSATSADAAGTPNELYARRLAARLSAGTHELPHDISERLRVARSRAVEHRRRPNRQIVAVGASGGTALLGMGPAWWTRLGAAIPVVALVAGLLTISIVQDDDRTRELADVDSALLADDLPPTAYADPGFAQFLKNEASER